MTKNDGVEGRVVKNMTAKATHKKQSQNKSVRSNSSALVLLYTSEQLRRSATSAGTALAECYIFAWRWRIVMHIRVKLLEINGIEQVRSNFIAGTVKEKGSGNVRS